MGAIQPAQLFSLYRHLQPPFVMPRVRFLQDLARPGEVGGRFEFGGYREAREEDARAAALEIAHQAHDFGSLRLRGLLEKWLSALPEVHHLFHPLCRIVLWRARA